MNVVCVCVCDGRKPECLLFCSSHSAVVRVRELTTVAYLPHAVAPRLSSRYLCLSVMPIHRMVFGVCDSYVLWAVWPWLVLTHKTAAQAMCFAWTAFLHRFNTRNTIHSHKCISYAVDVSAHTYIRTRTHYQPAHDVEICVEPSKLELCLRNAEANIIHWESTSSCWAMQTYRKRNNS